MTRGRGGRPASGSGFTTDTQQQFLAEVAAGARLGEAAATVGVHRNVPSNHARIDAAFARALEEATARGKAARQDRVPHGEYRYKNLGCRCKKICTPAATAARARHRKATADKDSDSPAAAVVRTLPQAADPESPTSFLLPGRSSSPRRTAA